LCFLLLPDDDEDETFGSDVVEGTLPVDALLVNHFVGFVRSCAKPMDGDVDLASPGDDGGWWWWGFGLNESLVDNDPNVAFLFGAISPRFLVPVVIVVSWSCYRTWVVCWLVCNANSGAIMSSRGPLGTTTRSIPWVPCCRREYAALDYEGNMEVEEQVATRNQLVTDFEPQRPSSPPCDTRCPLSGATE
jgi:hypothetical protein